MIIIVMTRMHCVACVHTLVQVWLWPMQHVGLYGCALVYIVLALEMRVFRTTVLCALHATTVLCALHATTLLCALHATTVLCTLPRASEAYYTYPRVWIHFQRQGHSQNVGQKAYAAVTAVAEVVFGTNCFGFVVRANVCCP
jgi:hypothetical protein